MKPKHRKAAELIEERRFDVELRAADDEKSAAPRIVGHPVVFNSPTSADFGFREIVRTGATKKSLSEGSDPRALFNHDRNFLLGRRSSGTLLLQEDEKGLAMDLTPPDTQMVRDFVLTPMARKDLREMSFGFRAIKENAKIIDGEVTRELLEVEVRDVSIVTYPAYPESSAELRTLANRYRDCQRVLEGGDIAEDEVREFIYGDPRPGGRISMLRRRLELDAVM